jgi:hypothetical protein
MYCSAPWTTIQIKNTGKFSYCCVSNDPLGNDLNDPVLVEGRKKMISGETLPSCQRACFDQEHLFPTQRQDLNRKFPIEHDVSEYANPEHIQYIDLRMGNICNYMCLMCGDRDSHLWGKANKKADPYISWARDPEQYQRIMDFIASCKNLKSISLAGGEPFYNKKQLFDIIDRLPRDMDLKFITNVSFCDDEIIAKLNEFKSGRLHCSIDGVGRWVETQRLRSEWNLIERNVLKFANELHENWTTMLVPTFTAINTYGLEEFADWIVNVYTPTRKNAKMSFTICQWPDHMTLYNIPLERRQQIVSNIRSKNYDHVNLNKLLDAVEKDTIPNADTAEKFKKYLKYVKHATGFDTLSGVPELSEIIGTTTIDE